MSDRQGSKKFRSPFEGSPEHEEAATPYQPASRSDAPQHPIELARDRHEADLLAIDGVLGVGVGRTSIGDEAILLYLRDESARDRVPRTIAGYPVESIITGPIDAYHRPGRPRDER